MNYLRTRTSADRKRTIDYVVRIDKPLGWIAATRAERLLYGAALTGPSFVQDSQEVYCIVKQWNLNTTAFAWVRIFDKRKYGRGAVAAMCNNYDGPVKMAKNIPNAEADLKNLNYKN